MEEVPFPPPGYTAVLVFDDPTPNRVIVDRLVQRSFRVIAQTTDLTGEDLNDLLDLIILIARKMGSVWRHKEEYLDEEKRLIEGYSSDTSATREHSEKLYDEFDVFAVQIKSTLDHLTKVMRPILGRNKWTLGTFGDKGERVLASLQRNTGKHYAGRVRSMEFLLFNDHHKKWLEAIIETRDRVNHHLGGGVKIDNFAVFRNPDGTVSVPRWSKEQELGKAMEGFWENFYVFVEDFLAMAINFRMRVEEFSLFREAKPVTSSASSWIVLPKAKADEFIKKHGATPV